MKKRLLMTAALLGFFAMPAFATIQEQRYSRNGKTIVIRITYTESNGNGRIDTIQELRSITDIQVAIIHS